MQISLNHFIQDPGQPRFEPVHSVAQAIRQRLLFETERQADAGARIVVWSEGSAMLFREQESAFLNQVAEVARRRKLYVFAALATFRGGTAAFQGQEGKIENKVAMFGPDGEQLAVYYKTKLPPGDPSVPGDGRIPVIATPFGKIATVICYDLDSPQFARQFGRKHADLVVAPSGDWRAIARHHARSAWFRALENGVSILRPVSHGLMLASDPVGRVRLFQASSGEISAVTVSVPVRGEATVYSRIGDSFVLLCAIVFLGLSAAGIWGFPLSARR